MAAFNEKYIFDFHNYNNLSIAFTDDKYEGAGKNLVGVDKKGRSFGAALLESLAIEAIRALVFSCRRWAVGDFVKFQVNDVSTLNALFAQPGASNPRLIRTT